MANRTRETTGWCARCNGRRLVRRHSLFQPWRCSVCGSVVRAAGDRATGDAEIRAERAGYDVQGTPLSIRPWLFQPMAIVAIAVLITVVAFVILHAAGH